MYCSTEKQINSSKYFNSDAKLQLITCMPKKK